MKWNLYLGEYRSGEGDTLPPWYYGYVYRDEWSKVIVFYPIPLHFFVRVGLMFAQGWRMFRLYGLESDWAQEERIKHQMYREGYEDGRRAAYHEGLLGALRRQVPVKRQSIKEAD